MLSNVLTFLQDQLSGQFKLIGLVDRSVHFPTYSTSGEASIHFQEGLNMMLMGFEEETTMRRADPFTAERNGNTIRVKPEIRLIAHVLFVGGMEDHLANVRLIDQVIRFFQARPVFDSDNTPDLSPNIIMLNIKLEFQSLQEQQDLWTSLRQPYRPCALYRIYMVTFQQALHFKKGLISKL